MGDQGLVLEDVSSWYGRSQALFGVCLEVGPGECLGLLGRTGAGKTTTILTILGLTSHSSGSIRLGGTELTGKAPESRVRLGMQWVPDARRLFIGLTVRENLEVAASALGSRQRAKAVDEVIDQFPKLRPLLGRRGNELSGGQQQLAAIARALVAAPDVLLIDEPSEGLAPIVVNEINTVLQMALTRGMAVVLSEQDTDFCLGLADKICLLSLGAVVFNGTADDFRHQADVQRRFLGVEVAG